MDLKTFKVMGLRQTPDRTLLGRIIDKSSDEPLVFVI
jgi:hypothetical protein